MGGRAGLMSFDDLQKRRIENAAAQFMSKNRPLPEIRSQVDFGYKVTGLSVELFEIRPRWKDPDTIMEIPFAKSTFVKSRNKWKIFWHRADMKWHGYEPHPEAQTIEEFFNVVNEDALCCFFG